MVDIHEVAEALGVVMLPSGEQWRGLCPLHSEDTPSFYTNDSKGVYHCFGCKVNGDAIDLVERVRHLTYIEALHYLAELADVDISAYERQPTDDERRQDEVRRFCEGMLARRFPNWPLPLRIDHDAARIFGVSDQRGAGDLPPYGIGSYLFDGVVLPWRLPNGRLVGWRVREHEGKPKKVLGTPNDFPLGALSITLFGIQVAREYITNGQLIAVEGEYDCMALHAVGIRNVVALGGSTLSVSQVELLQRLHIRELVVVFDGDEGGRAAAKSLAEHQWANPNLLARVTTCDYSMDPEDVVKTYGDWAMAAIIRDAPVALEYLLRREWSTRDRGTLSSKLEFVKYIHDTYGAKLRSTDESLVLAEVAKWLEIPEVEVRDFVRGAESNNLVAPDSERILLGRACRDKRFYIYLREQLDATAFFVLKHRRVWDLLADMLIDGLEFDGATLAAKEAVYGVPSGYIAGMLALPDGNLDYHREQVADLALRRDARDDVVTFKDRITDLTQSAEVLVGDLTHQVTSKALRRTGSMSRQVTEQVDKAMEVLHERMRNPTEIHGLDLGAQFPNLSLKLQGLQPKRLVLVAALSRIGKSTLMLHWAASLGVHQSIPIDFVSLEMDEIEILYKIASHMTAIDSMKISGGSLDINEIAAVERAMIRIRNSPLRIWTPDGLTPTEFLLHAREQTMQRHIRAVFLDYVQLIDPEAGEARLSGYERLGDFGRLMKMKVARGMDIAVICAAQLNRDARNKEQPTGEDMGDSYALTRHSDVIMILSGNDDSSTIELRIDKNRQGQGGGLIPLTYTRPTQTFHELAGGARLPEYLVTTS
jgi:replicative DNA helicase